MRLLSIILKFVNSVYDQLFPKQTWYNYIRNYIYSIFSSPFFITFILYIIYNCLKRAGGNIIETISIYISNYIRQKLIGNKRQLSESIAIFRDYKELDDGNIGIKEKAFFNTDQYREVRANNIEEAKQIQNNEMKLNGNHQGIWIELPKEVEMRSETKMITTNNVSSELVPAEKSIQLRNQDHSEDGEIVRRPVCSSSTQTDRSQPIQGRRQISYQNH